MSNLPMCCTLSDFRAPRADSSANLMRLLCVVCLIPVRAEANPAGVDCKTQWIAKSALQKSCTVYDFGSVCADSAMDWGALLSPMECIRRPAEVLYCVRVMGLFG